MVMLESKSMIVLLSHIQSGAGYIMPEKLIQIFGLSANVHALPIVGGDEYYAIRLVVGHQKRPRTASTQETKKISAVLAS